MLPKGHILRLFFRIAVLLFLIRAIASDEYVKDLRKNCSKTKRPYFCVTYRIAKYVQNFDYQGWDFGPAKLVKIKPSFKHSDTLLAPRYMSDDSEWNKLVKFLQRKLIIFLITHGIAFQVPEGVQIVESRSLDEVPFQDKSTDLAATNGEGRGKIKQKKIFILSIIIMAKLIKILLLISMIFFVLLFIKKIILITAIVFPSVLSHIKQACMRHHQTAAIAEEVPAHSGSWFGWRQDNLQEKSSYWPYIN